MKKVIFAFVVDLSVNFVRTPKRVVQLFETSNFTIINDIPFALYQSWLKIIFIAIKKKTKKFAKTTFVDFSKRAVNFIKALQYYRSHCF